MDDLTPFGGLPYFSMLGLMLFGRGMDFLSTWTATPNLILEGNPLAKKLGWKWGLIVNIALCFFLALWPLVTIVISTSSVLVASRNFQHAWLMRTLGEEAYRQWHITRLCEARISLFLLCLLGNTGLTALVGGVLIYFAQGYLVAEGIGIGILTYAVTVAFYTMLSVWRVRRAFR